MALEHKDEYARQCKAVKAWIKNMGRQSQAEGVKVQETHISWVLLTEKYAYKIKKSVNLGFLDFSTLEKRHFYCKEEIRLNSRLAPNIYIEVSSIGGDEDSPMLGEEPVIEYAVKMRRFPIFNQFDKLVLKNNLLPEHIDKLADTVAKFHLELPLASVDSIFASVKMVRQEVDQNFEQLMLLAISDDDSVKIQELRQHLKREEVNLNSQIEDRKRNGFVRECHGDLHLGNIVLLAGEPTPFDGIEFNPALRWIDVISDIAFTVMDLQFHERKNLAWRFLSRYLECTGDYKGANLLSFYIAYRAMVRAKVSAIYASGLVEEDGNKVEAMRACANYITLAANSIKPQKALLIITHGLPGSGKSTFAQLAVERLQGIRLRSDVERKRLFKINNIGFDQGGAGVDLYTPEISERTYQRLHELAGGLLSSGITVIVDAAFLKRKERAAFQELAAKLGVNFAIASVQTSDETMRKRIKQRLLAANDASDADVTVLEKLTHTQEPLTSAEQGFVVNFNNDEGNMSASQPGWNRLQALQSEY